MAQFFPRIKFYIPLLLDVVMFDEFLKNKGKWIRTNDEIEPYLQRYLTNSL